MFHLMNYKSSNEESDLRIPLTKSSLEPKSSFKRSEVEQKQIIPNLPDFFANLEKLFLQDKEGNRLTILNEINKFNDIYCKIDIPYDGGLISSNIAHYLIDLLSPIDPIGSASARMIIFIIRSSEHFAEVFVDEHVIDKIESIIFRTQISKERTKEFLLILYCLANTTEAYRDLVFSHTNMHQLISFCLAKPDTMHFREFLLSFMIILCKYDNISDDIFQCASSLMDVIYDNYKDDPKFQKDIVRLIQYLSFSPNFVPIIEESSIGDDLFHMLNNKETFIIRCVAIIFANLLRNGIGYSELIGDSLKIFIEYPNDPCIIIPTCDIFVSLILKSSNTTDNPDFGLSFSDLVNMIPLQQIIEIIENGNLSSKEAALKVLRTLFQYDMNSIQNCISFGLIEHIMNLLQSNEKFLIKDAVLIAITLIKTDCDINSNSTLHNYFIENDGLSIFNEIEESFVEDEELIFSIQTFIYKYYPST